MLLIRYKINFKVLYCLARFKYAQIELTLVVLRKYIRVTSVIHTHIVVDSNECTLMVL